MDKEFKTRKGTCNCCGKKNVTNVYCESRLFVGWFCWKCAKEMFGIKPPEKKFTATIGDMIKVQNQNK